MSNEPVELRDGATKEYSNDDVTVVWKPDICRHTGICALGLMRVFNPRRKPWIDMKAASTEQIIDQVEQCPSGALSYYMRE